MTAAELLRNAQPPADDGLIDQAIADLDMKIWEWAESLKSAQTQLRSAFATSTRPATRPSAALYDDLPVKISPAAAAAAAAATLPPTPPTPDWMKMPAPAEVPAWAPTTAADAPFAAQPNFQGSDAPAWPQPHGGHGASASSPTPSQSTGVMPVSPAAPSVMQWPSAGGTSTTMAWPDQQQSGGSSGGGVQQWPTWTPTDTSQGQAGAKKGAAPASGVRATKAPKATRETPPPGPTPEERAQKAAAEEALLSELEEAIARRVRLLRRLDPDTAIEKLIEKARQGQAEAASAAPARDDKSSSWWRRK